MHNAIHFPIVQHLSVNDYGLYPGTRSKPGLELSFSPGLTLVVGTNGLGKTTLATLLFRMLSGPFDLSGNTLSSAELGGASLDAIQLSSRARSMFADRVSDRAANAVAVLDVELGGKTLQISRSMKTLTLSRLTVDGADIAPNEADLHSILVGLSGLSSYGDWLMFLRQLVFYFEDRRSLVWDASAQHQVFRMLFLPPAESKELYEEERRILEMDSRIRNDRAALTRLQDRVAKDDEKQSQGEELSGRVQSLEPLQLRDEAKRAQLIKDIDEVDEQRRSLRRQLLEAEDHSSRLQEQLEDVRLRIIHDQFPSKAETAKYLLSLLMLDGKCAVCSSGHPGLAEALDERISHAQCVLCGSPSNDDHLEQIPAADVESLDSIRDALERSRVRVDQLQIELTAASGSYEVQSNHLIQLTDQIKSRDQLLSTLRQALPEKEDKQLQAKNELGALQSKIDQDRIELDVLTGAFIRRTQVFNERVQARVSEIKRAFGTYAQGFLYETVALKWTPRMRRLGQLQKIDSASFELDMGGTDFEAVHRREGPGAVSESQREFIDLAFRMALIEVAGQGAGGTLVIDAPESSLDAVFVERAAAVLCRFGRAGGPNRLMIASNLVDGRLLPELIRLGVPEAEQDQRLLNLLDVAVPTAAVRVEEGKYRAEWADILKQGFNG